MPALLEVLEEFTKKIGFIGTRRSMIERLLFGMTLAELHSDKEVEQKEFALIAQFEIKEGLSFDITDYAVIGGLPVAIRESVKLYVPDKSFAIGIYEKFDAFLKNDYDIEIKIEFPPKFLSDADRQLYLLKVVHDNPCTVEQLEDKVWYTKRTLEGDLALLQSEPSPSIMGQPVRIRKMVADNGKVEYVSKTHPLLLNVRFLQLITILDGMRTLYEQSEEKEQALHIAGALWQEISEETKQKIVAHVSKDADEQDERTMDWFEKISDKDTVQAFLDDSKIFDDAQDNEDKVDILYYLENQETCNIEIDDGKRYKRILSGTRIIKYDPDKGYVVVSAGNSSEVIKVTDIKRIKAIG